MSTDFEYALALVQASSKAIQLHAQLEVWEKQGLILAQRLTQGEEFSDDERVKVALSRAWKMVQAVDEVLACPAR